MQESGFFKKANPWNIDPAGFLPPAVPSPTIYVIEMRPNVYDFSLTMRLTGMRNSHR